MRGIAVADNPDGPVGALASTTRILTALANAVGAANVHTGDTLSPDYAHDEGLGVEPVLPMAVVTPASTSEVASVVRIAYDASLALTARGSGTGLSGACIASPGGVVVSFERMNRLLDIDEGNAVAVVQPGLTLAMLDEALAPRGLLYPVMPGESSASLGGNIATNAGGMRAIKHGVTRHHVLGLEAVIGTGETIRTGGRFVKSSAGYDLTQLIIGSEGTLGLVTEATLKLQPRLGHAATVLAPFTTLRGVSEAVPQIVASGIGPAVLEYMDLLTLESTTQAAGIDLGVPADVREHALAFLVVVLESNQPERLDEDVETLASLLASLGALDVYVLPSAAGSQLIEARERAFFVAKAAGADDLVDVVVPRAQMPDYLERVEDLARSDEALVAGCGHAGDGNVHLSVFQPDSERRHHLMQAILATGLDVGGAISGEHGLGTAKREYFLDLEDPIKLTLMRRIKSSFDPKGILNPGKGMAAAMPVPPGGSAR